MEIEVKLPELGEEDVDRAKVSFFYVDEGEEVKEGDKVVALGQDVLDSFDEISSIYAAARAIEAEYPDSVGGRCLREMLEVGLADELETSGYVDQVRERVSAMAGGSR